MPVLNNAQILNIFSDLEMVQVLPTKTGRYIVPIPNMEGESEFRFPNIKSANIRFGGDKHSLEVLKSEASPQIAPTDGSCCLIINRVTEIQAEIYDRLYNRFTDDGSKPFTYESFTEYLGLIQGIRYKNRETHELVYEDENLGLHGDVFHTLKTELEKRYIAAKDYDGFVAEPDKYPEKTPIALGLHYKKPYPFKACFLEGSFEKEVHTGKTQTNQLFPNGGLIIIPCHHSITAPTAVSLEDADSNYNHLDGRKLKDKDGKLVAVPTYKTTDLLHTAKQEARQSIKPTHNAGNVKH